MDFLIELVFELLFEGISEAAQSKRLPFAIRIIASALIILCFFAVAAIIALAGVIALKENTLIGSFLFILDAVIVIAIIRKVIKFKKTRSDKKG